MSMGVAVMMLVVAMLIMVVVMLIAVAAMMMCMVMVMIMVMAVVVVMTAVAVIMIVRGMGGRIGAAFGIERRLDLDHARTESLHHFLDDVIAPDAQAAGHDLGRQMAIAEVPGDPYQMAGIGAPDLEQRLGRGHHLDQPAVFQHQRIAAA